jgi:hypothetical protein
MTPTPGTDTTPAPWQDEKKHESGRTVRSTVGGGRAAVNGHRTGGVAGVS